MRSRLFCIALLPLFVLALALPAHADPMDDFSIIGGGATIDFSLPASTTQAGAPNQFNSFPPVSGTVNNVTELIIIDFILPGPCSVCGTIQLSYPSAGWTIFLPSLPPLYDITFSGTFPNQDETLTFVPGDYMTGGYSNSQPFGTVPFEIKITPEAAATPEPPTLFLLGAAALAGGLLMRRRALA